MAVGALERDLAVALGHRHHRQTAALTFAGAVGQKVAQVPADLLENDAFCCSVPYTGRDRRAFWARRLFAPGQRSAASPWKGRIVTECGRTSSCTSALPPSTKSALARSANEFSRPSPTSA